MKFIFFKPKSIPPAPEYRLKVFITFVNNFDNLQVYMIYNLINYSLEQKLYDYTLNQIDENLLEIILDDNKYLYIVQRFKDQLIKDLQQKKNTTQS